MNLFRNGESNKQNSNHTTRFFIFIKNINQVLQCFHRINSSYYGYIMPMIVVDDALDLYFIFAVIS